MSITAHRIIEIKYADGPGFKLWDNSKLMQFLEENTDFNSCFNSKGAGMFEIPIKILKKAVKMSKILDIDEKTVKLMQQDIEFAKSNKDEVVLYDCF